MRHWFAVLYASEDRMQGISGSAELSVNGSLQITDAPAKEQPTTKFAGEVAIANFATRENGIEAGFSQMEIAAGCGHPLYSKSGPPRHRTRRSPAPGLVLTELISTRSFTSTVRPGFVQLSLPEPPVFECMSDLQRLW